MEAWRSKSWSDRHLPEKRKQDRHTIKNRSRGGEHIAKSINGSFIAVDGESWQVAGKHTYVLLGSVDGYIYNYRGLNAKQCFDFLLSLRDPRKWLVGFSFNYDVTMIIKDLPEVFLKALHTTGAAVVKLNGVVYRVQYIRGKNFTVSRGEYTSKGFVSEQSVTVYDVFGFFQKSFVESLKKHGLLLDEYASFLEKMKSARQHFSEKQRASIIKYNRLECSLLERLMEKIKDAYNGAGLYLDRWHGAGAGANALLKKYKVKRLLPVLDPVSRTLALASYYGARIEVLQSGVFDTVHSYDIRSAYPFAFSRIPHLSGKYSLAFSFQKNSIGIWRVKWDVGKSTLSPFPFRLKGRVHWGNRGEGWYTTYEVKEALKTYPRKVEVMYGFVFEQGDKLPYTFIEELYNTRRRMKNEGDPAELGIKLSLNSLYGKMAQGQGYAGVPQFQNYLIASLITSRCRSEVFKLAAHDPESVIAFATDGILTTRPLPARLTENLGDWEYKQLHDLFIFQPGFYQAGSVVHFRGFKRNEVNFSLLRKLYAKSGCYFEHEVTCNRFMGLGTGLAWGRVNDIGSWFDMKKTVTGRTNKIPMPMQGGITRFSNRKFNGISEVFSPKRTGETDDLEERRIYLEQDHTLALFEQE